MDPASPRYKKECHVFEADGRTILFDVEGIRAFYVNDVEREILALCDGRSEREIVDALGAVYPSHLIRNALTRLNDMGLIAERCPESATIKAPDQMEVTHLNIDLAHDCDMACGYCYLAPILQRAKPRYMNEKTAKKAIDFLMNISGDSKTVYVSFYGGEPLLASTLLKRTVDYANEQASSRERDIFFDITTNGLQLKANIVRDLTKRRVFISASIDGTQDVHDALRKKEEGANTYSRVVDAVRMLNNLSFNGFGLRATATVQDFDWAGQITHLLNIAPSAHQLYLVQAVLKGDDPLAVSEHHIADIKSALSDVRRLIQDHVLSKNSTWIGNLEDDIWQIANKKRKLYSCGAGVRNLTVCPQGDLYTCSGLVGNPVFRVGDIFNGIDFDKRKKWMIDHIVAATDQTDWSRFLSGGSCYFRSFVLDGDTRSVDFVEREISQYAYEQAIATYLYLAEKSPGLLASRYNSRTEPNHEATPELPHECMLHRVHRQNPYMRQDPTCS